MYNDHTIGVVIPAYNEEGFVGRVIDTIPEWVDRIYAVDDCSTDGTWNEIHRRTSEDNDEGTDAVSDGITADGGQKSQQHVVPIRHEENRGVGGAIKTGYQYALSDEIDITVVMGGDGQMNPDHLPRLLDPIVEDRVDYAKGNRLLFEEYRDSMPTWRLFGNSILSFLTKISSGYWKTMDPQNGYTAISKHALENVAVDEMYEYYGYCNDLLVKLNAAEMRIADVAIPAEYGNEESSITYPTYIRKVSWMLLRNFAWRLKAKYLVRDFHPIALFYCLGASAVITSAIGGILSIYAAARSDERVSDRVLDNIVLFTIGWLSLLFAILFDMQENEDKEVQIRE